MAENTTEDAVIEQKKSQQKDEEKKEDSVVKEEEKKEEKEVKEEKQEEKKEEEKKEEEEKEEQKEDEKEKEEKSEEKKEEKKEKKKMKAIQYTSYGGGADALKSVEITVPTPKKDEVLIKTEAVGLNPLDWKIQNGMMRPFTPRQFPCTPSSDVAGEVVEVGSEVKNFKAGDKVVALLNLHVGGGLAEYAVAKENLTAKRPDEVSAAEAAGLPVAGLTAHQALTTAGIKLDGSGQAANVLVTAGSGGVGMFTIQLAKLANAHVTATCGERNIEFLKSLGADEVLDYKTPEGASLKSPSGKKYDAVVHCTTGISWSAFSSNLNSHGKVIDLTPSPKAYWSYAVKKVTFSKKMLIPMFVSGKGENLDFLVKLMKEGKLKTVIDSKHPFAKAQDAWAKSAEGHATGKIIVEF